MENDVEKRRKERRRRIRAAIKASGGSVTKAAEALGMTRRGLSRQLLHHTLAPWWLAYKKNKIAESARGRWARAKRRRREAELRAQGLDPADHCAWLRA